MPDEFTVALVRLCECEGTVQEVAAVYGSLTEKGRSQAAALRERLRQLRPRGFFAPQNSACQETAAILSGTLPVQTMVEFSTPPYPRWQGLTLSEIALRWPAEWHRYLHPRLGDADEIIVPEGETFRTTYQRAKVGLDRLYREQRARGTVVVVTHGEVTRLLIMGLLGAPLENLFRLRSQNGSVSMFSYDGERATFDCISDTSHIPASAPAKDMTDYFRGGA